VNRFTKKNKTVTYHLLEASQKQALAASRSVDNRPDSERDENDARGTVPKNHRTRIEYCLGKEHRAKTAQ
jgi:hypothetical protein